MATAKKGKKTSGSKKSSKSKKKSGNSSFFTRFILILLVLAMIVTAILFSLKNFSFEKIQVKNDTNEKQTEIVVKREEEKKTVKHEEKKAVKPEVSTPKKEEPKKDEKTKKNHNELKTIEGCWLSSEQGAFITIDQFGYRIDFSNVDASKPLTGNYYIENNLITFTSDGNECGGLEGTYRITFYKKNISLICKKDDCTTRRNILEADWEWVEI